MAADGHNDVEEERLIRFMSDPGIYGHRPKSVRLIQTHASLVFVASPLVFKIKKPVNFGFLDFSTLEKRRHFCERELELNQRLCPEGYLEVVPITLEDGDLQLDGTGTPVEYALRMKEFSEDGFFDRRVESGKVTTDDLDRIVETLTNFYEAQHPTLEIGEWGSLEKLRISTDENFAQTEAFVGKTITASAFAAIQHFTNRFYKVQANLLESRVAGGWIRDCHGDLHLEHIHLTAEHLHIYDCIEFNDRLRYVDVASDAAFLAMDLDFRGRRDLSRHFVGRLADRLKDGEMKRLMPFYQCYRAYVRGKVESLQSGSPEAGEEDKKAAAERAARYFRLSLAYAVSGTKPLLIAVMGRVASGKSTLAERLGSELGWEVFSSDKIRKELAGVPLTERVDDEARRRLYSPQMSVRTYARMWQEATAEARARGGAVMDATFSLRRGRRELREKADSEEVEPRFVWVEADQARREKRLVQRESKERVVSDARHEDRSTLDERFEEPKSDEGGIVKVESDGAEPPVKSALVSLAECAARDEGG